MPVPVHHPSIPLHRVRFFDHTPSPITALAFAPLPLPLARDPATVKGKAKSDGQDANELGALIAARENGEVEIWDYVAAEEGGMGNWVLTKTLPPTLTHPTISNMALVIRDPEGFHSKPYNVPRIPDLRLFTAGSDSTDLTERCLETGRVLQTYPIPSPPLWSLSVSPTQSLLCLTTNSASLHFVSIPPPLYGSGPTALEPAPQHLLRSDALPSRCRTVSVAWGVPKLVQEENGDWAWRDSYLITGNSDSSFRRWDLPSPSSAGSAAGRVTIKSRAVVEKVSKGKKGGHKGTIVWGVGVLPDGTIVTSDSLGSVTFWDAATMSQRQTFRSHKADGMCMTIGPGGRSVFTSGPDQRVCQFTAVPQANGSVQWAITATKRIHTHDVRALAIFPTYVPLPSSHPLAPTPLNPNLAPVLASGGWDMSLALTPAAAPELLAEKLRNPLGKLKSGTSRVVFEEAYPRRLDMFGGSRGASRVDFARGARLVVGRKDRGVGVWRVLEDEKGWEKVLEMDLKLRTNLIASAVSQDGQWLAVSDLYETKLFHLASGPTSALKPIRVRDFVSDLITSPALASLNLGGKGCGASSLLFTPDSGRLVLSLAASAHTVVLELPNEDRSGVSVAKCFPPQHSLVAGRTVKGNRRQHQRKRAAAAEVDSDVDMEANGHADSDSSDEEESAPVTAGHPSWITTLAASDDGQYLASSDLAGRVTIFNLDLLSTHALLPTLPHAPAALAFAPTHPLLLLLSPANSVSFYHLDARRLLPSPASQQIQILNSTLRGLHAGVLGASFEPSTLAPKAAKIVFWAADWLATARIDLDLVAKSAKKGLAGAAAPSPAPAPGSPGGELSSKQLRRKRAREARDQLEASSYTPSLASSEAGVPLSPASPSASLARALLKPSIPSSASDPSFVKIATDKFRCVVACGWFGEGEMAVVERPQGDFADEVPAAFWTGGYGKA